MPSEHVDNNQTVLSTAGSTESRLSWNILYWSLLKYRYQWHCFHFKSPGSGASSARNEIRPLLYKIQHQNEKVTMAIKAF